jgi:hypothetical protein
MDLGNRARAFLSRVWKEGGGVGSSGSSFEKISMAELGRAHARIGNPNTGIPETLVQDIYDIYFVAPAAAMGKLFLFTTAQGSIYNFNGVTAFNKTADHTYLTQPGQLDSSYSFVIRAIAIYVQGLQGQAGGPYLSIADLGNFLSSYVELDINRKPWVQGIAGWFPAAGGIMGAGVGSLTAPAASFTSTNGLPYRNNAYALPGGIFINPQENFQFVVDPTGNAGGTPSAGVAVLPTAGVPAAGLSAWVRFMGQLVRVA